MGTWGKKRSEIDRRLASPFQGEEGEWVYGIKPIEEVLKAGRRRIHELWITSGTENQRIRRILQEASAVKVNEITKGEMDTIAQGGVHQGVLARVDPFPWESLDEIFNGTGPIVVLDGIQDPRNLGAIIRSSVAMGAPRIIMEKRRRSRITPATQKAACGATEYVRIAKVPNLARAMREGKERGYWFAGTSDREGEYLWDAEIPEDVGVVIGGEGKGIRPIVGKQCDLWLRIPHEGCIGTYNASVATSVILYELMRRRRGKGQ